MLGYLILLFTVVPALELYILIKAGSIIGPMNTVLVVIFTGVIGAFLAKMEGLKLLQKIQEDTAAGRLPADSLLDGLIIFGSGLLLLTPGFLTDIAGFAGLWIVTRAVFKLWLKRKFEDMISKGQVFTITPGNW